MTVTGLPKKSESALLGIDISSIRGVAALACEQPQSKSAIVARAVEITRIPI